MPGNRLSLLSTISSEMLAEGSLEVRANRLVVEAARAFGVDSCIIRTLEPDGNLKLLAAIGVEGMTIAPLIPAFYGISRGMLEDRISVGIDDASTHPLTSLLYAKGKNVPGRFVFESYAGAPMLTADGSVGIIGIYSCHTKRVFTPDDLSFLQIVANHFGVLVCHHRLLENLENRVQERTAELARAKDAAESAERAKTEFLACMSHELRTPLNSIVGFSQVLATATLGEREREAVGAINQSARLLLDLISDILDYSRLDGGTVVTELRPFSPRETILRTFELLRSQAETRRLAYDLTLSDSLPEQLMGDAVRLSQVVMHLLSNAVKFTEVGHVRLTAEFTTLPGEQIESLGVRIEDTGIGIPETMQSRVFAPFTQGDSSDARRHGGTGLGLSITRRVVDAMGGQITLNSREGTGTTFVVRLPFVRPTAQPTLPGAVPHLADPSSSISLLRLLVVEDNAPNRLVIRRMLERLGVKNSTMAEDGEEALRILQKSSFDLILMDVQMPKLDGLECTRRIRRAKSAVPIVAITAGAQEGDRERCLAAGMNDYMTKPVEMAVLKEVLQRYALSAATSATH